MRVCRGELNTKTRSMSQVAYQLQRSSVGIYDLGDNRQPQSYARLLCRHKWVENLLFQFRRNSRTAIFNLHHNAAVSRFVIRRAESHAQFATLLAHGFAGVHEEVGKDLVTQVMI